MQKGKKLHLKGGSGGGGEGKETAGTGIPKVVGNFIRQEPLRKEQEP